MVVTVRRVVVGGEIVVVQWLDSSGSVIRVNNG